MYCQVNWGDVGPEASAQPVPMMSPKSFGLVMRKNYRTDATQQTRDRSWNVY